VVSRTEMMPNGLPEVELVASVGCWKAVGDSGGRAARASADAAAAAAGRLLGRSVVEVSCT
jgi:hypothetical protein